MGFQNWYCYCFILVSFSLYSQPGKNSNWYFGTNAGVSFNTGVPVALINGAVVTTEGVATISDNSGNLLFYTDGVTVYNRNHLVMTNGTGLFGDASSTQSAVIVEKPGAANIYYIFTSDNDAGPNGICYSIVDMTLSLGLGAVTSKNISLHTPSCEKLCVVRHCNNVDFWVISHDWNSNVFRTWSVTNLMVGNVQAWSATGIVPSGITQTSYGQLKASSDGKKIAACYYGLTGSGGNKLQLYDFDNATGWLSNAQTLASDQGLYGCEFSPNNKVLYASTNGGALIQFDLCANPISRYLVYNTGPFMGALQIAPDSKIYVTRNATSLSVINNPNIVGIGCNYTNLNISLLGRSSRFSLPNHASYYNYQPLILNQPQTLTCTSFQFTAPILQQTCNTANYNILWNFGDGTTSTEINPIHDYLIPGTYTVTFSIGTGCVNDQVTINVTTINSILLSQINHN
jgi:hypothetical protein